MFLFVVKRVHARMLTLITVSTLEHVHSNYRHSFSLFMFFRRSRSFFKFTYAPYVFVLVQPQANVRYRTLSVVWDADRRYETVQHHHHGLDEEASPQLQCNSLSWRRLNVIMWINTRYVVRCPSSRSLTGNEIGADCRVFPQYMLCLQRCTQVSTAGSGP